MLELLNISKTYRTRGKGTSPKRCEFTVWRSWNGFHFREKRLR